MSKAAIVIGVNKTGGLPPLAGAVSGAKLFAKWAKKQGLAVTLITDEGTRTVTLSKLQDAVEQITAPRTCEKLIVFFAGHGFLLGPQTELWLLSKAPGRTTEAVNVFASLEAARYSGIEHVIFVSDACRSGGPSHQHRSVQGGSIFPAPSNYDSDGKLDKFYATRPGDTALEYRDPDEAVQNYRGLFTECLLEALEGKEPRVVHEVTEGSTKRWLVPSHLLDTHLRTTVPVRAEAISIKLSQSPIIIPESRLPQYFGELNTPPPPGRAARRAGPSPAAPPPPPDLTAFAGAAEPEAMSFARDTNTVRNTATSEIDNVFADQVDLLLSAKGRGHYETQTGFTVYGRVRSVLAGDGINVEPFEDGDLTHIRVHDPHDYVGRSILIEFESGLGTALAIKPLFIGAVVVDGDQVVNVSYTPSKNTDLYRDEYKDEADRIERRRAFAATATRHGVFELGPDKAQEAGDYLRMLKGLDPTLGIYAAYAYFQAGRMKQVLSILNYMQNDPPPIPFDVALLARFPGDWSRPDAPLAPFCPMLRQGWALLDLHPALAEALQDFRPHLLPSVWTTFTPAGVDRVRTALERGDFK